MWVLMRSRVVSYRIVLPLCRFQTADSVPLMSIIQPNQSSQISAHCSMQQNVPIWRTEAYSFSGYKAIFTTNYLTLPSYGTRNFYSLHTEWNLWKRFKLKNDDWLCEGWLCCRDSNSRGTSQPPHCVFFQLYTAELSCFFFIPVKFTPLHRWMVILHMAKLKNNEISRCESNFWDKILDFQRL